MAQHRYDIDCKLPFLSPLSTHDEQYRYDRYIKYWLNNSVSKWQDVVRIYQNREIYNSIDLNPNY